MVWIGKADVKQIKAGVLSVAYEEHGPSNGAVIVLLHGFPYDTASYADVAARLCGSGALGDCSFSARLWADALPLAGAPRVGQQAALGSDLLDLLDALGIGRAMLAGYDWGGRAACVVAALHPDRVTGLVSGGTGYNIQKSTEVLKPQDPDAERRHWYWYYLNSKRGNAARESDRANFCRRLWRDFSPTWNFDDAIYARTASRVLNSYTKRLLPKAGKCRPSVVMAGA